ncbi:MAG TPA: hypothetical protein VHO06_06550 [Polyangia bacterium]|nr:hypothetical protein [Polyangia bacterium]
MDRPGMDLGARVGFAIPMGDLAADNQLGNFLSGAVPLTLELTIRGNKNVAVGLAFDLAPTLTKNCDPGASCSATDYRLNLEAIFTSRAGMPVDPWLGIGVGYEWFELSESGELSAEFTGWDYATIEVGGEFRSGDQLALGPFASFSLGQFSSGSANGASGDVANPSLHEWLQFGLRGTINL